MVSKVIFHLENVVSLSVRCHSRGGSVVAGDVAQGWAIECIANQWTKAGEQPVSHISYLQISQNGDFISSGIFGVRTHSVTGIYWA